MAKIEKTGDPYARISAHNLPADGIYDDATALALCVQDTIATESWLESHFYSLRWTEADLLYQSPPMLKVWEGTSIPRANVSRFTVATHTNALLAQITNGMFYEEPPFVLRPRPKTKENTARAITAVQGAQLDEMNFREETKRGMFNAILFGTGVWKWGWKVETKVDKQYRRKEAPPEFDAGGQTIKIPTTKSKEFEVVETERTVQAPYIEALDIRHVLTDPGTRIGDIREAKYVIHRQAFTFRDLINMRDEQLLLGDSDYNLPDEATIKSWFETPVETSKADDGNVNNGSSTYVHHAAPRFEKTTADPLDEPLEVLERWTPTGVITVLNRSLVIRNGRNPFGCIPFYSVNWWNIPDAFLGMGLGLLLGYEQRIQQGITNATLDMTSLIVNPLVVRSRGANITTQSIRQRLGGIVDVDGDAEKAFKYQEVPQIPGEIFAQVQQSEARSEAVSGANELLTMGNMPSKGRTSIGRTATGASALSSAASSRIGAFVEDFNRQVFQPWLWEMHQLNCERLPVEDLKKILSDELGEDFAIDEEDYFNAAIKEFEVLAGSHLAVKQQMAQSITLMSQLFQSPQIMSELAQINQEYVDVGELLHMIADMSGFKNYYSIIKKMTPEMKQNIDNNNPAKIQAEQKQQLQAQQQQHESQLTDQKDINRAVILAMRNVIEQSVKPEAVSGEATGQGFGSNELG